MKYCRAAEEFEPFVRASGFSQIIDNLAMSMDEHPSAIIYRLRAGLGSHPEDSIVAIGLRNIAEDNGFLRVGIKAQLTMAMIVSDDFRWRYGFFYEEVNPMSPEIWEAIFNVLREGLPPAQFSIIEFWLNHENSVNYVLSDGERNLLEAASKNTERFLWGKLKKIMF